MINKTEAIDILNKEKDYEDELADNIYHFLLYSLDKISDVSDEEKDRIRRGLEVIQKESIKHSVSFKFLIELVLDNGEDNF